MFEEIKEQVKSIKDRLSGVGTVYLDINTWQVIESSLEEATTASNEEHLMVVAAKSNSRFKDQFPVDVIPFDEIRSEAFGRVNARLRSTGLARSMRIVKLIGDYKLASKPGYDVSIHPIKQVLSENREIVTGVNFKVTKSKK